MKDQISIRPGVGMLGLFPHMKYQPWYALGELVDNAIQSYLANERALRDADPAYRLQVEIEISRDADGSIVVRDNAAGIHARDWERALRVAEPPEDATGLSQFGVGMKAACCWFAKRWTIRTSALGEDVARSVSFDVPAIIASRDETVPVDMSPANQGEHYTTIEMTSLNRPVQSRTLGKIRNYLGGIYRQFLRDGRLSLMVNGEMVGFEDPTILEAPLFSDPDGPVRLWRQNVDLTLDSGRRVRGFVAIREKGEARQAGLALFYRDKVVTGSGEEVYKPDEIFKGGNSYESQRIFGELHMDDFDVTYTKDALVWHDEEEEFVGKLRTALSQDPWPLIRQAREHRKRVADLAPTDVAQDVLDRISFSFQAAHEAEKTQEEAGSQDGPSADGVAAGHGHDSPSEAVGPDPATVNRIVPVDLRGHHWDVDMRLVAGSPFDPWITVLRGEGNHLSITLNQAHPFMRAYCELPGQELEPVWRVAIALGLAQEMARGAGISMAGTVTRYVNDLLGGVLWRKN